MAPEFDGENQFNLTIESDGEDRSDLASDPDYVPHDLELDLLVPKLPTATSSVRTAKRKHTDIEYENSKFKNRKYKSLKTLYRLPKYDIDSENREDEISSEAVSDGPKRQ